MKKIAILAIGLCFALSNVASAASCRDAKGKFITCPAAPAAKKSCRDGKGKFVKCTTATTSTPPA